MKNEAAFWSSWVEPMLYQPTRGCVAWKVPAEVRKGLPDVWYMVPNASGWLELKYHRAWPARENTELEVAVTVEQMAHLREAGEVGAGAWILVGVGGVGFLFEWRDLKPMEKLTKAAFYARARWVGARGDPSLIDALRGSSIGTRAIRPRAQLRPS